MQGVKHAAANAKEKLGNVTAKVEEKMDKGKASAAEKVCMHYFTVWSLEL